MMKTKLTFLSVLIFMSTSVFCQTTVQRKNSYVKQQFSDNRPGNTGGKITRGKHNSLLYGKSGPVQFRILKSENVIAQSLDSIVWQGWDEVTNKWVLYDKEHYLYNALGENTEYIEYEINQATGQWVGYYKDEYSYDDGNMIRDITYNFDENAGQWVESWKAEYLYNINNKIAEALNYDWDKSTGQWLVTYKSEYSYNPGGYLALVTGSYWNETSLSWVTVNKEEYSYNANGTLALYVAYYWDEFSLEWMEIAKSEYTYDANGYRLSEIEYEWNFISNEWEYSWKQEYAYDASNNLDQEIDYIWDSSINQWINETNRQFSYNNAYTIDDLILPYVPDENMYVYFSHMLTGIDEALWDEGSNQWLDSDKATFYYSDFNFTSVNDNIAGTYKISPNPVTDYLSISIPSGFNKAEIEIFDMQSRKVFAYQIKENEKVNLKSLDIGIYYFTLAIDGKRYGGKLVKN